MNGLAEESQPTGAHPISYPFRSYDGQVTFTREQWGQRTFDLNTDGVANYGMFPDWLQELQTLAGRPILSDMFHGAEAYLEMWERAYGVPQAHCVSRTGSFGAGGAGGLRLGATAQVGVVCRGTAGVASRPVLPLLRHRRRERRDRVPELRPHRSCRDDRRAGTGRACAGSANACGVSTR